MEQRRDKRMDRISNLPVEVIDAILVRLPLKDAVRESILSSKWKDKWVTLSKLAFSDYDAEESELVTIVDQVLLLHQGPLQKFSFECFLDSFSPIDRWINHLSRKGAKEIGINAMIDWHNESVYYKVSSRLFNCQEITSLLLWYCAVKLPPSFEVFPNLRNLNLHQVVWDKCDINMTISKCPRLERLIFFAYSVASIKINNPNLEFLDISGYIAAIHFESAPLLSEMSFDSCISRSITVSGPLCSELKMPPFALCNLENLSMDICFKDQSDILALLCLLRTSCSLLKLNLRGGYKYTDSPVASGSLKAWKDLNCKLNKLVEVSITDVSNLADSLEFIEVVLANSPVLQKMAISNPCKDVSIFKKLLQFQRASPEAKILWI